MTINDFEKFIDPKIVERGENYYFNDAVINIEKITPEKWRAQVEGTEIYNVEIKLEGNEILESFCDCPYDFGPYCKHEVAFFYALQEQDIQTNSPENKKNKQNKNKLSKSEKLDKILSKANKDDLLKFIREKALSDDILYSSIVSFFGLNNENIDKSEYYNIIKNHLNHAKDRHGYIDYYHASHSVEGADTILNQARDAMDNQNYAIAIAMAQSVTEVMIPALQEVDDSDGYFGSTIDEGFNILYECSHFDLNENIRKEFFKYCITEMKKKKYDGWPDWQLDFLRIAENLAKEKNELDNIINIIDNYDNEISKYYDERLLLLKYDILIKSGNLKEAEIFFQSNLHLPDFRKIAIENALSKKKFIEAEELAFEGEKINKEYPGIVDNWKKYRLRIYEETGNIDKQRELLKEFAMKENFDYYLKLKKTYKKDEWQNVYDEIINKIKKENSRYASSFLMKIYVKENLLKELLAEIKKEPSYILEYDDLLMKEYSKDVYELYKINLLDKAKHSDKRSRYQELCNIIRRLLKIGGKDTVLEIINFFKTEYKYKRAFMDELSKIKIK